MSDSVIAKLDGSVYSILGVSAAPKIKICGLRRPEDIEYANRYRPDYVGFIFDDTKRRFIPPKEAAELKAGLSGMIQAVGVFVDAEVSYVRDAAELGALDMIQLHGTEDNDYIREVRRVTHGRLPIIKAFTVASVEDVDEADKTEADYILLDNGTGTGRAFDWTALTGKTLSRPFFLAGGLRPDNVEEAVRKFRPYAVDASSSLETDGYKDPEKIERFITAVRAVGVIPVQEEPPL